MRNGLWKPIYKYNLDLKMTYENKWELKPNYKHKWRLKSTYEYKWIMKMDYKYKWDIFLDYDMKNHDIHENKNVCPEFNGEKMHEHTKPRNPWFYKGFWGFPYCTDITLTPLNKMLCLWQQSILFLIMIQKHQNPL